MKTTIIPLLLSILACFSVKASHPEFFGASATTAAIGNQATSDAQEPANLYYSPALTGWAKKLSISAQSSVVTASFEDITSIVTENSTNGQTGTTTVSGNANTNYGDTYSTSIHVVLPLAEEMGTLGISFFAPIGKLAETNSGNARLPEYSLYRARYKRTQLHANYAYPLNENWSFSLGAHIGFQVSARVNTQVSLTDNFGSEGNAITKIEPSVGGIFSLAYREEGFTSYFTFQQEMKSNLEAIATGEIADPALSLINVGLDSMIYYDPHIIRVGMVRNFTNYDLFTSLEYQLWDSYEAPIIEVRNLGGSVRASDNFEQLSLRNIFVPKVGLRYHIGDDISLNLGAFYRQTPFDSDFSGSGNTIDADVVGASTGLTYGLNLFKKDIELAIAGQYQKLLEETVIKTANQEDGSAGVKIGSPGFTIGGNVLTVTAGFRVQF